MFRITGFYTYWLQFNISIRHETPLLYARRFIEHDVVYIDLSQRIEKQKKRTSGNGNRKRTLSVCHRGWQTTIWKKFNRFTRVGTRKKFNRSGCNSDEKHLNSTRVESQIARVEEFTSPIKYFISDQTLIITYEHATEC